MICFFRILKSVPMVFRVRLTETRFICADLKRAKERRNISIFGDAGAPFTFLFTFVVIRLLIN